MRLVTTTGIAEQFGVSMDTVYRWVRDGLTAYRLGPRFYRIDADEAECELLQRT